MTELISGIHQVDGVNANSYIVVENDGSLTLIDSGMPKDGKKILDYVKSGMSKNASDVKTIVLTHSHVDHVRGAAALKNATGAKIVIHQLDADYLSGKKKMIAPKGAIGFIFGMVSPLMSFTPVEADQKLNEGDMAGSLTVIHTPGHTPGSISLYNQERKVIFVGDTIRYANGKIEGPPAAFTQDVEQAAKSVEKISGYDFDVMLSGHGEPLRSNASEKVKELSFRISR